MHVAGLGSWLSRLGRSAVFAIGARHLPKLAGGTLRGLPLLPPRRVCGRHGPPGCVRAHSACHRPDRGLAPLGLERP